MADTFYRWFSERKLTGAGASRRKRIEESRLGLVMKYTRPPGDMLEIGPGHGTLARARGRGRLAISRRRGQPRARRRAARAKASTSSQAWTPPIPAADASADVVYADQVLEHMSGIDAARAVRRRSATRPAPGRRALRRRARLPEGARRSSGTSTTRTTSSRPSGASGSCSTTADSTSSAWCAASAPPPGPARDVLARARCSRTFPGSTRCRATRGTEDAALQGPQEPLRNAGLRGAQSRTAGLTFAVYLLAQSSVQSEVLHGTGLRGQVPRQRRRSARRATWSTRTSRSIRPLHPTVLIFHCTFVCDARCEMCSNWTRGNRKEDMTLAQIEQAFSRTSGRTSRTPRSPAASRPPATTWSRSRA